jgi:hypothetical protein
VRDYLKFENPSRPGTDTEVISPLNKDASGDSISNNIFLKLEVRS